MFRPRVIPVLLFKGLGLFKTKKFKNPNYLGDPINTVKLFNDLQADELMILDISASNENRTISLDFVKEIGDEAFMPFSVGGGIKNVKEAVKLIQSGSEKVIISEAFVKNPALIGQISKELGSQSVTVCLDVKKTFFMRYEVRYRNGRIKGKKTLLEYVKLAEDYGAGEIMINCIDKDGTMTGYDFEIIKEINKSVNIPSIICGGAGNIMDLKLAYIHGAQAIAAGSMFVYHGPRKAVLINYPSREELFKLFAE
ncbi:cyclase [Aquiflexum balticum DSM 16537]|uniref:imidazole glycerol-phosphate synthase n=1 Tax=Aquiflexum balticum DSM 16537 TaxID=758820 RepID=A0A1W2H616_9BACT|nr:AglZ/HisF2 family acetamidino modification protein [Aquiflexum balticum]SMD44068.1 cyclase [Aquiflexum balticum DSM 16537]